MSRVARRITITLVTLVLFVLALGGGYWIGAGWPMTARAFASPSELLPSNVPGDSEPDPSATAGMVELSPSATPTPTPTSTPTRVRPTPKPTKAGPPPKMIFLTFDDGPDPTWTPQVLSILKKYGAKATFFEQGAMVEAYPEVAKQVTTAGHRVANHSWNHPYFTKLSYNSLMNNQLARTNEKIQEVTGHYPTCVRPPFGAVNSTVRGVIADADMDVAMWDVDPKDWAKPGASVIASRVLSNAYPGAVVLLHDAGGDRSQTVAALPTILTQLKAQGYHFGLMCRS